MASSVQTRPSFVRYLVLAVLCAAAVVAYVHRGCLAVPKLSIRDDLALSDLQMAQVLGAFYLGYALFQIPGGWLSDRWGTRRTLPACIVIWSTAVGLMSLAHSFEALLALHVVNGMAQAAIFPCCVKSFSHWFPAPERAFPSGALSSFMSVGGALGSVLTGLILLRTSWESMLLFLALPGFVFAGFLFFWFRDHPTEHPWVNEHEREWIATSATVSAPRGAAERVPWQTLFTSSRMGLICAQQFFRAAAYIFYTTQFPTYLQETRGVSQSESGYLAGIPLLGVVGAGLVGGFAMDLLLRKTGSMAWSRKGVALSGTLGGAFFLVIAYFCADLYIAIGFMTMSMFCAGLAGPAGYTVTIDQGGKHVATVFSIMNTAGNIAATIYPVALELLVAATDWKYALVYTASLYFIAAVCWALLQVRGSIFEKAQS